MRAKRTWLIYLDQIENQDKDATDPTYLMQAFNLTRLNAKNVIVMWQQLKAGGKYKGLLKCASAN